MRSGCCRKVYKRRVHERKGGMGGAGRGWRRRETRIIKTYVVSGCIMNSYTGSVRGKSSFDGPRCRYGLLHWQSLLSRMSGP